MRAGFISLPSRTRPLVRKLQSCCRAVEPQQQQSSGARELPSKPADLGGNNPRRIVVGRDDGGAMAQIPKDMRAVIAAHSGLGVALPTLHTTSHTYTDYLTHTHTFTRQTHTHSEPRANSATTRQLKHEHFLRFAYAPARKPIGRMFLSLCPPVRRSACISACRGSASALCVIIRFCHNIELAPVYFELPSTLLLPLNRSYHGGLTPVANGITATWPHGHHTTQQPTLRRRNM